MSCCFQKSKFHIKLQDFLLQDEVLSTYINHNLGCSIKCQEIAVKWPGAPSVMDEDHEMVLVDISFTVQPGQSLAIVGPVGSGKVKSLYNHSRFMIWV